MRELQTTDSEPKMGHEDSKEKNVVELSNDERLVSKKKKLIGGNPRTETRSATMAGGGGTSTFTLKDNPVDSIIYDLEGVRKNEMRSMRCRCNKWEKWWPILRGRFWLPRYKRQYKIHSDFGSWKVRWTTLLRKIRRPRSNCKSWRRSDGNS
jgi:hypothetical protein